MDATRWVTVQIMSVRRQPEPTTHRIRSSGYVVSGSASDCVMAWLSRQHGAAWWTRQQIIIGTGCTGKAVDWALLFLRATKRIDIAGDPRNARYLRYQCAR